MQSNLLHHEGLSATRNEVKPGVPGALFLEMHYTVSWKFINFHIFNVARQKKKVGLVSNIICTCVMRPYITKMKQLKRSLRNPAFEGHLLDDRTEI